MSECPHCGAGPGELCARLGWCKLTRDGSSPLPPRSDADAEDEE